MPLKRLCKSVLLVAGIVFAVPAIAQESGVKPIDSDYDRMPTNTVVPEYPEKARMQRIEFGQRLLVTVTFNQGLVCCVQGTIL